MAKFKYNYVLIYRWHIEDDAPTNEDILRTPFDWNYQKIGDYVKKHYGIRARFEIITNELTVAEQAEKG